MLSVSLHSQRQRRILDMEIIITVCAPHVDDHQVVVERSHKDHPFFGFDVPHFVVHGFELFELGRCAGGQTNQEETVGLKNKLGANETSFCFFNRRHFFRRLFDRFREGDLPAGPGADDLFAVKRLPAHQRMASQAYQEDQNSFHAARDL